jgi:hypothetical protein
MRRSIILSLTLAVAATALADQVIVGNKVMTMTLPFCGI